MTNAVPGPPVTGPRRATPARETVQVIDVPGVIGFRAFSAGTATPRSRLVVEDGVTELHVRGLEGGPLDEWLAEKGAFDAPSAVAMLQRVLLVLAEAHDAGVYHGQLSPAWMWFTPPTGVQVVGLGLDWGTAADAAVDLASVAEVGWAMLTPRAAPDQAATIAIDSGVPEELVAFLLRLQADRPSRHRSARDALNELGQLAELVGPALPSPSAAPTAALIGRDADLERLQRAASKAHLVTVLGPAGIGKTALVRAWTAASKGQPVLVPLADARTPDDVMAQIALALNVERRSGQTLESAVHERLTRGALTLVIDNVEQVVGILAPWVRSWLDAGCRFVLTSRVRLALADEHIVEVGALAPDDAVALFLERARARTPGWGSNDADADSIRRTVAAVEGIPLAVELIAARSSLLSPQELWARLSAHDAPEALTSLGVPGAMRQTLDLSWDLLGPEERTALVQLTLFRTGFTLHQAESFLGVLRDPSPIELVDDLRAASWLRELPAPAGDAKRFGFFVVVWTYLQARVVPDTDALRRHDEVVVATMDARTRRVEGPECIPADQGLSGQLQDVIDIIRRTSESNPPLAARAVVAAAPTLSSRFTVTERLALFAQAERHTPPGSELWWRLRSAQLNGLFNADRMNDILSMASEIEQAQPTPGHEEALRTARYIRGIARFDLFGDVRGLDEVRQVRDEWLACNTARGLFIALNCLLWESVASPNDALIRDVGERTLEIARRAGNTGLEGFVLSYLAEWAIDHEPDQAEPRARRALATIQESGAWSHRGTAQFTLARALFLSDELEECEDIARLVERESVARGRPDPFATMLLAQVALSRGQVAEASSLATTALGVSEERQHARGLWFSHLLLALIAIAQRDTVGFDATMAKFSRGASPFPLELVEPGLRDLHRRAHAGQSGQPLADAAESAWPRHHAGTDLHILAFRRWAQTEDSATIRPVALRLGPELTWIAVGDAAPIDLRRKGAARNVLAALLEAHREQPGKGLSRQALIDAGWPGEKMYPECAVNRLHVMLARLRSSGLRDVIVRSEEGHGLAPHLTPVQE